MPILKTKPLPRVALVGRTNVGKSTLWNRLTESGRALVSDSPHTTRDRNYGIVVWQGMTFELVDTGGMDTESTDIGANIRLQALHALREADIVLFVVDARVGVLPQDRELARSIQKEHKNIWLIANKVDTANVIPMAYESGFFQLGFQEPHLVSATTGLGVGDLLDDILRALEKEGRSAEPLPETAELKLAVVGRPNVGKSSLVNSILGEPRVIVSPVAHTTREPQDTRFRYADQEMILVDTAGMRKMAHITDRIEEAGIERNQAAIKEADIALLVFDASELPSAQDRHLAGMLEDSAKGIILVANKWDLVKAKTTHSADEYEKNIRDMFDFLSWAPLVFVSAKTGQRTTSLLDTALKVAAERVRHIDYNALNRLLKACIKTKRPLASYGPNSPRIYDVAQVGTKPPTFLITVHGDKENIHPSWIRFFEKRLRQKFDFTGTSIVAKVRVLPVSKSKHKKNVNGPGMVAVAGSADEPKRKVNQTRRRQKGR